jgi:hypothetical protein
VLLFLPSILTPFTIDAFTPNTSPFSTVPKTRTIPNTVHHFSRSGLGLVCPVEPTLDLDPDRESTTSEPVDVSVVQLCCPFRILVRDCLVELSERFIRVHAYSVPTHSDLSLACFHCGGVPVRVTTFPCAQTVEPSFLRSASSHRKRPLDSSTVLLRAW